MYYDLEIVIPVLNEKDNISKTLLNILENVKLNFRIIIVYDYDSDPTLDIIKKNFENKKICIVKNKYQGFSGAVKTGFELSKSKAVMMYPADDLINFNLISIMFSKFLDGYDVVCASRFMKGGEFKNAPIIKSILVKIVSFAVSNFTKLQTKDPTNGFRLFSNNFIKKYPIKSKTGFSYGIELLAKAYRNGYKITEVPEKWPHRVHGKSKFKYSSILYYFPWFLRILIPNLKKNENKEKN